jgi:signal transduction histidine kinase
VLAHSLAALAIQLEGAEALLADGQDPARALQHVRRSRRLAVEGLAEARSAIAALRGESPALPDALERLLEGDGGGAELRVLGTPRPLAADVELALQRIAREALTNARKHAPGAAVAAELRYAASEVALTVRSGAANGTSALAGAGGGFGLQGMHERAALIGARLEAGPDEGGWRVEARVPDGAP